MDKVNAYCQWFYVLYNNKSMECRGLCRYYGWTLKQGRYCTGQIVDGLLKEHECPKFSIEGRLHIKILEAKKITYKMEVKNGNKS
jgi:hypothetical protein